MSSDDPHRRGRPNESSSEIQTGGQSSSWVPIAAVVAVIALAAATSLGPRVLEVFGW